MTRITHVYYKCWCIFVAFYFEMYQLTRLGIKYMSIFSYLTIKNVDGKNIWQIRIAGSLAEKTLANLIHSYAILYVF